MKKQKVNIDNYKVDYSLTLKENADKAGITQTLEGGDTGRYIYLIENCVTKFYKIGITNNIDRRIKELENASGMELSCVGYTYCNSEIDNNASASEIFIHNYFKPKRTLGEWFDLSLEDIAEIRELFYDIGEIDHSICCIDLPETRSELKFEYDE